MTIVYVLFGAIIYFVILSLLGAWLRLKSGTNDHRIINYKNRNRHRRR